MATNVHQTPVTLMELGALARAAVLLIERHLSVWIAEHALAQHAAAEAAISRRQVRNIRTLYIAVPSGWAAPGTDRPRHRHHAP